MDNPLVSIIIPVHNAAGYLDKCLVSIEDQTYKNIEIILVNDGSEDESLQICMEYQKKDPRFRVIDKPNTGVSDTRNTGMLEARGKYLQFVDSDDWVADYSTGLMVEAAEKTGSDMIITHFFRVIGKKMSLQGHIKSLELMDRQKFAEYMMQAPANYYYGVMWNKLFRRDIIEQNKLGCIVGLNWCEDFIFNLEYIQYTKKIYALPIPTYYYVKTKNSLVATEINIKQTIKVKLLIFDYYKELYKSLDLYDENKRKIQKFMISAAKDGGILPYKVKSTNTGKKKEKIKTDKLSSRKINI